MAFYSVTVPNGAPVTLHSLILAANASESKNVKSVLLQADPGNGGNDIVGGHGALNPPTAPAPTFGNPPALSATNYGFRLKSGDSVSFNSGGSRSAVEDLNLILVLAIIGAPKLNVDIER